MSRKNSHCPISKALDLLGDKWTLLIIRDLFTGKSRYKDFQKSSEKIATNILANRLQKLEQAGIIKSRSDSQAAKIKYYSLTRKGIELYPVLDSIGHWGLKHIEGTEKLVKQVE